MEGDKVQGMGWVLLGWLVALLAMFLVLGLMTGCNPSLEVVRPQNEQAVYAIPEAPPDVTLNYITRDELLLFLKEDQCDKCRSSLDEPVSEMCLDRASCLTCSARSRGWDTFGVLMNFENGSHVIVAFPTKDGDLIYVEPWFDQIVTYVKVGDNYIDNFYGMQGTQIIEKIELIY